VTVVAPAPAGLRRALNGRVLVVFPRFSDLAARITIEPDLTDEKGYLARAFATVGIEPDAVVVGIEPTPAEIEEAAARAADADATVLFVYDARLYASNRALLDAIQDRARTLAVVLMRDPYDAALLRSGVFGLTAYGFRRCQLDAVISRLGF
jgi:hypothetical protein